MQDRKSSPVQCHWTQRSFGTLRDVQLPLHLQLLVQSWVCTVKWRDQSGWRPGKEVDVNGNILLIVGESKTWNKISNAFCRGETLTSYVSQQHPVQQHSVCGSLGCYQRVLKVLQGLGEPGLASVTTEDTGELHPLQAQVRACEKSGRPEKWRKMRSGF